MMLIRRIAAVFLLLVAAAVTPARADDTVTGRLLAVQGGYVFFTTGDTYRAAPGVRIVDEATGKPAESPPVAGSYVTLTLDAGGNVATITELPAAPADRSAMNAVKGALVLPPFANPDAGRPNSATLVKVTFSVRVPASTAPGDQVYLTEEQRGWNPLLVRMDRLDALHFRTIISVAPGYAFRYLYTRGNSPTIERGANGLQRKPRVLVLTSDAPRSIDDSIEHWGDEVGSQLLPAPQVTPTPYNPAPYPNLPIAVPAGGAR